MKIVEWEGDTYRLVRCYHPNACDECDVTLRGESCDIYAEDLLDDYCGQDKDVCLKRVDPLHMALIRAEAAT